MAQTHLKEPRTTRAAPAERAGWRAGLLAGLEWALLLGALGAWGMSQVYHPWMAYGAGMVVASWGLRWARMGKLAPPTPLEWPLALFMLSALAGLWAAPQLGVALARWYLFVGALALFYAIAGSSNQGLEVIGLGLVGFAAALGVYFVTQHPWAEAVVKFDVVREVGVTLSSRVPDLGQEKPHPNVVASVLGVMVPVGLAGMWRGWKIWRASQGRRGLWTAGLTGLGLAVIVPTLVLTESRATWVGLAAAGALAGWWWLAGKLAPGRQLGAFWMGLMVGAALVITLAAWQPAWLMWAFGGSPGPNNTALSRLALFGQVWRLAQDTPFTGGGLGAFPALYSTFILDLPFLNLTHSHNSYLNVLLEQGWLGVAALGLALAASGFAATRALSRAGFAPHPMLAAGAAGLVVIAVQGLADATLVASRAGLFLWVPAALVAATLPTPTAETRSATARGKWRWLALAALAVVVVAGGLWRRPLLAAWQANLAAVRYDRLGLADWPTGLWADRDEAARLAPAIADLEAALALDPDNGGARLRLGLQRRMDHDFTVAAEHLAQVYASDPGHRGVVKMLGYTYAWLGDYEAARPLLAKIPEASAELETYRWWWGTQGRADLGVRAGEMWQALRQ